MRGVLSRSGRSRFVSQWLRISHLRAQHPYTHGLMGSIPVIRHDVEELTQIDGAMPRLTDIPAGCAFNPRCPRVFEYCRVARPDLMEVGTTRAACWLYDEGQAQAGDAHG